MLTARELTLIESAKLCGVAPRAYLREASFPELEIIAP
jgi:hypothetical protein